MELKELKGMLETTREALESSLDRIHWRAGELVVDYQDFHFKENKERKNWEDKSQISLKTKRRGTSIGIWWVKLKWSGVSGKRQCYTREFKKPRGKFEYDLENVLTEAQNWEKEKIRSVEAEAAQLRLMAAIVSEQLLKIVKNLKKIEKYHGQD
ncbi:conjugative transfer protein MobI(A/C) [Denitratisoma oestradiolicum]|uniref:Uncharacterized protein n=1 Tax=Denitratisoma oestradiolicum TaxID=311182 RepID=A0A6S6Y730_9PROT|nr:conjugative transfer protein MobI(A/C) [Denitratisoma oestradiolicum]CAB1368278.1 conserved protein of unknown function [Denitratisoma oestradiolicum]